MSAPEHLVQAVKELARETGQEFQISSTPVQGTEMFVVFATCHELPARYTPQIVTLGFRVPSTFPNAAPEDCFFLWPADVKLSVPDPIRNDMTIHRTAVDANIAQQVFPSPVRTFSWHLWDRHPWDRNKHTLADQYRHILRRFDAQEHD